MSRRYAPDHKELIIRLVKDAFKGDVAATARYAHIPERTLRDWLHTLRLQEMYRKALAKHQQAAYRQPPPPPKRPL